MNRLEKTTYLLCFDEVTILFFELKQNFMLLEKLGGLHFYGYMLPSCMTLQLWTFHSLTDSTDFFPQFLL